MNYRTGWWLPDTIQRERKLFENEYLRREFKLILHSGQQERDSQLEIALEGGHAVVVTDDSKRSFKELKCFPKKSIALIILSDETYNIKLNFLALINSRISLVVRNYPKANVSKLTRTPVLFVEKIARVSKFPTLLYRLPRVIFSGAYISISQMLMQLIAKVLRKPLFEIPQGYDSGFGRIYAEYFGLNEDTSLFATALEAPTSWFPKEISLCFLGQQGNLDRRIMLAELRKEMVDSFSKNNLEININQDYQAGRRNAQQQSYFRIIKKSKFALCPPGNYSSSTFRYFEALLVHALPICDKFVFSDPLAPERVSEKWSTGALKKKLDPDRINEDENEQVVYALKIVMDSVSFVRQKLSNL